MVASVAALTGGEPPHQAVVGRESGAVDRRQVVFGSGAAAVLAVGGILTWRSGRNDSPPTEAELLLQKGLDALQQNDALDSEQQVNAAQAVALLTKATEAGPENPTAWGALAMAYAVRRRAAPLAERPGLAERSRSAARRAIALEKNESRASAALMMLATVYRNWAAAERAGREALRLHPGFPIHAFLLSDVLGSVGRWREAAGVSLKADRKKFLIPGADRKVVVNLWAAGRLAEADVALNETIGRWPDHPQVWRTQLAYLMYGGRPAEALALLNRSERPAAISADLVDVARATGEVLAGTGGSAAAALEANVGFVKENPGSAIQVAQACCAIGEKATAMALLAGYYFRQAPWASLAPPGGDSERLTSALFMPPMRGLWRDPAFAALLRRIGLEDYWRRSRTVPDFRRTA